MAFNLSESDMIGYDRNYFLNWLFVRMCQGVCVCECMRKGLCVSVYELGGTIIHKVRCRTGQDRMHLCMRNSYFNSVSQSVLRVTFKLAKLIING